MKPSFRNLAPSYFRNFIFGVEDSLVSTVGLLSGIAAAEFSKSAILLTGIILILVEASSMAAGSFLSEFSAEEYAKTSDHPVKNSFISASIMFFSYFFSGFIPLFPYVLFPPLRAMIISILLSILSLFFLGVIGAKISKASVLKNSIRMAVIGGIAIVLGFTAGILIPNV
ncbi:MAG: hypothetical protein A2934_02655 [Candidatus Sungbacteria bacterium RIFCSPLOWO2_01_FULL_47_10]|uniref:VIT family protein n=1 Tax=Candidatus Sungbacteria bacterium RIFCSPLOWO2_01_FULL_47_10 TaxID=1802276 RepID=A0A1G2KYS8_9BACT|nr:MAG: hypothetical protein A2934_02655 [Candidatus Sungbacteria bacterium RIFCSPLOWO2_01_FULL_47_10]